MYSTLSRSSFVYFVSSAFAILILKASRIPLSAFARICFDSKDPVDVEGDVIVSFEIDSRRCCDTLSDDFRARFRTSLSPPLTVDIERFVYSRFAVGVSPCSSRCLRAAWLTKNVLILQINSVGKWFNFFRFTKVRKNLFDFSGPYPDSFCLIFIISWHKYLQKKLQDSNLDRLNRSQDRWPPPLPTVA